jgi:hypothetical protein
MDRRRRVLRENAEQIPTRLAARNRSKRTDEIDDDPFAPRRDVGYSQEVRRACQQRMVAVIPVRRLSLGLYLGLSLFVFSALIAAHYYFHVLGSPQMRQLPIAYLFHLRSPHSIAQWLGTHLWLLTAIVGVLIFQIRKHRLDDYQASYRIWLGMIAAALFASFDGSSSVLMLFGTSIDGWARSQIGYSGFAVVLAGFASIVGFIALRLCTELKSSPAALVFWISGLLCWGGSALYGTGLLKNNWNAEQMDMLVGGGWLGGITAVFLASGIYLRQIYIHAQRRFVERGGMLSRPLRMPSMPWKNRSVPRDADETARDQPRRGLLPFGLRFRRDPGAEFADDQLSEDQLTEEAAQNSPKKKRKASSNDEASPSAPQSSGNAHSTRKSRRNPTEETDDVADDGRPRKKPWWNWSKKTRVDYDEDGNPIEPTDNDENEGRRSQLDSTDEGAETELPVRKPSLWRRKKQETSSDDNVETETTRRGWWGRRSKDVDAEPTRRSSEKSRDRAAEKRAAAEKRSLEKEQRRLDKVAAKEAASTKRTDRRQKKSEDTATAKDSDRKPGGWFSRRSKGVAPDLKTSSSGESDSPDRSSVTKEGKRGLFGFLDNMKLKPPADSQDSDAKSDGPTKVDFKKRNRPSTADFEENDLDDMDEQPDRQLSKAERKRQRRENRRAA